MAGEAFTAATATAVNVHSITMKCHRLPLWARHEHFPRDTGTQLIGSLIIMPRVIGLVSGSMLELSGRQFPGSVSFRWRRLVGWLVGSLARREFCFVNKPTSQSRLPTGRPKGHPGRAICQSRWVVSALHTQFSIEQPFLASKASHRSSENSLASLNCAHPRLNRLAV